MFREDLIIAGKILPAGSKVFIDGTEPNEEQKEQIEAAIKRLSPEQQESIEVETKTATPLPANFPGIALLRSVNIQTYEDLADLEEEQVNSIPGMSPELKEKIGDRQRLRFLTVRIQSGFWPSG